ncbi:glycoside hydrolase family 3 protein [uncultured Microbulbifer sp.]|mgnify:CR=1 FL=1|uniref:glycoside hydrolase family 3 protein n=1 Tax=uncultured Microbulbifer sp. TaxID=348147 RepID=UPI0025D4D55F|nr:glycoside hydrolase family 3 protein [uncultured Microbulbifer sp.]
MKILLRPVLVTFSALALTLSTACSDNSRETREESDTVASGTPLSLREKIAQKIMLDIRFYCADGAQSAEGTPHSPHCDQPVTSLLPALGEMIRRTGVGGIILFADNLQDSAQIVGLNRSLQEAAAKSASRTPLLIGIDQEGGRVNRLPRAEAAAFAGNMAIGATYPHHGEHFAAATAEVMADQLRVLGFNVNFAPTLDVNSNPENPVINVRSYAETPEIVADLGAASVAAFQRQGIAATVKHFPGHGDTSVDSHTGLPRVERTLDKANAIDLLPFARVIEQSQPALTMTAHIQYPALDNTTLRSRSGEQVLVPATLSHKILTELLREQMGYQGVIVTDAMDMAGISDYFSAADAVVKTFAAGADIALMPVKIRYPEDLYRVDEIIDRVENAVASGELSSELLDASVRRVLKLKQEFVDPAWVQQDQESAVASAQSLLATPAHRTLARELATAALTAVSRPDTAKLPVIDVGTKHVQVLAPNLAVGEAFKVALSAVTAAEIEVLDPATASETVARRPAEALVVASIVPAESAVELGGAEDLERPRKPLRSLSVAELYDVYRDSMLTVRQRGGKTVFVSMRSPYEAARFTEFADMRLASYDYKAFIDADNQMHGPVYRALAEALVSRELPQGQLPVTVAPVGATGATIAGSK